MNALIQLVLFALVAILLLEYQKGVNADERTCKQVVADLTKKQLNGISGCTKSLKLNPKEKAKKMACLMKCVLKKEALLDEKGQLTPEQYGKFLEKHFPPAMFEKANSTFGGCVEAVSGGMDDQEEFCKDYDALIKCLLGNFPNMCKK